MKRRTVTLEVEVEGDGDLPKQLRDAVFCLRHKPYYDIKRVEVVKVDD